MAPDHAQRATHTVTGIVIALLAAVACHGSGTTPHVASVPKSVAHCAAEGPGVLRVANFTGKDIEIFALRPLDHWRVFLAQVPAGTTELNIPGPADLGVRYDAVEPAQGIWLGTVTWIRPASRGGTSSNLVLELQCPDTTAT